MRRWSAILLVLVFLFQVGSKTFILLHYTLNVAAITEVYCVNKTRPAMRCNGRCHLSKQLAADNARNSETPAAPQKVKADAPVEALVNASTQLHVPPGAQRAIVAAAPALCREAFCRTPERPPDV